MKSKIIHLNTTYQAKVEHLLEQVKEYGDARLNANASNGGWSAIQTMHHLILAEELSLSYVRKKLSFNPALPAPGLGSRLRVFLLWFYLNLPIKFKAPKIVGDENLPGFSSLEETRERWSRVREEWTRFILDMPGDVAGKVVYRHPVVGRLSWAGNLLFFHYHFDRHRRQIERVLNEHSAA